MKKPTAFWEIMKELTDAKARIAVLEEFVKAWDKYRKHPIMENEIALRGAREAVGVVK